jgi:hypothetical protein
VLNPVGGGCGGEYDAHARTKNEMKQTPEIKVKKKFPNTIPTAQKRKLKPDITENTTFRLIWEKLWGSKLPSNHKKQINTI